MISTYAKVEELTEKMKSVSTNIPQSIEKETILYSDSISKLNQTIYKDGLDQEEDSHSLLLHAINTINYLVGEIDRLKFIVNHS